MYALDTYSYVKKLKEAGMPEEQASVQAEAFYALAESKLVTKHDLLGTRQEIKHEMQEVRAEMRGIKVDLEARIDQQIDRLDTKLDQQIDRLDTKLDQQIDRLDARIDVTFQALKTDIVNLNRRIMTMTLIVIAALGSLQTIFRLFGH